MSDIFEKYAELALERGLISNAENDSPKNPRMSSKDISAIEVLYGVKTDSNKGMEYKNNISEVAHPNAVVVSSAHDKLNGLVENINERQAIMINIVNKTPNGHLTNHKWASDELVRSLVRIANDMDNKDSEELRVLADSCLEQMHKQAGFWDKIKSYLGDDASQIGSDVVETGKGVGAGAAVGGVIGGVLGGIFGVGAGAIPGAWLGMQIGGVAGGLIAAVAKTSPSAKSVALATDDALSQLKDLNNKFSDNAFLLKLNSELLKLKKLAEDYVMWSNKVYDEKSVMSQSSIDEAAQKTTEEYLAQMKVLKVLILDFNKKASTGEFEEQSGISKIKSVIYNFIDDDVDDEKESLANLLKNINMATAQIEKLKTDVAKAKSSEAAPVATATPPVAAAPVAAKPKSEEEELYAELANLEKKYPGITQKLKQKAT